jgi:hypothetical protein
LLIFDRNPKFNDLSSLIFPKHLFFGYYSVI